MIFFNMNPDRLIDPNSKFLMNHSDPVEIFIYLKVSFVVPLYIEIMNKWAVAVLRNDETE